MTAADLERDGVVAFPSEFAPRYRREGLWRGETRGGILRGTRGDNAPVGAGGQSLEPGEVAPRAAGRPRPGDVALFLRARGTTGLPKLIPRTHDAYAYNVRASAELCGFDRSTVYLVALPAGHNFPFGCPGILGTLHVGGTVVILEN